MCLKSCSSLKIFVHVLTPQIYNIMLYINAYVLLLMSIIYPNASAGQTAVVCLSSRNIIEHF